jgi:hypothetical protein
MVQPQIYEGTAEEIAAQLRRSNLAGRLKAIITPDELFVQNGSTANQGEKLADFLAELDQAELMPGKPLTDPHEQEVSRLIAQKFTQNGHTR